MIAIPSDFEVQPISPDDPAASDPATCGTCGLTWDDGISTGWTPAPSGRCPFEYFHPAIRLEELRAELRAERISYGELVELQGLAGHIEPGDVELREAAGAVLAKRTLEEDAAPPGLVALGAVILDRGAPIPLELGDDHRADWDEFVDYLEPRGEA